MSGKNMRIVKLSKQISPTRDSVRHVFLNEIPRRKPSGKFRVTSRRIAQDALDRGEPLVFSYQSRAMFTANAGSELIPNDDEARTTYPNYFIIDLATLQEADEDLHNVERRYNEVAVTGVNIVNTRGWNRLLDPLGAEAVWDQLREHVNLALAEEITDPAGLVEGAVRKISVNSYERDPEARRRCIEHYGPNCGVCGFNFGAVYGDVAEGFIHVHHLRSLSEIGHQYVINPIKDLRPVCPNCHAVLHLSVPPFSIEEVQTFLRQKG